MSDTFNGVGQSSSGGTHRQHEDSLIKMGALPPRKEIHLPKGMEYLFDLFLEVRFSRSGDNKLIPREPLTFGTLNDYKNIMQVDISPTECSLIMSADGIYETKAN